MPLPVPVRIDIDTDMLPIADKRLLHPHHNPRWDPASPHALAALLADISARQSPLQSSTLVTDFEDGLELSPPLDSSDDSDTPSPPDVSELVSGRPLPTQSILLSASKKQPAPQEQASGDANGSEPLKQSLRGIFTLWKLSRPQMGIASDAQDKEAFMRLVGEAIGL